MNFKEYEGEDSLIRVLISMKGIITKTRRNMLLTMVMIAAVYISACGSDQATTGQPGLSSNVSSPNKSELDNDWYLGTYKLVNRPGYGNNFVELRDGGTIIVGASSTNERYTGTYEVSGNALKVHWDNYTPAYEEDSISNGVIIDDQGKRYEK